MTDIDDQMDALFALIDQRRRERLAQSIGIDSRIYTVLPEAEVEQLIRSGHARELHRRFREVVNGCADG